MLRGPRKPEFPAQEVQREDLMMFARQSRSRDMHTYILRPNCLAGSHIANINSKGEACVFLCGASGDVVAQKNVCS